MPAAELTFLLIFRRPESKMLLDVSCCTRHDGTSKLARRRIFRLAAEAGKLLVGKEVV